MKTARVAIKSFFVVFLLLSAVIFLFLGYVEQNVDDSYKVNRGENLKINTAVPIKVQFDGALSSRAMLNKNVGDVFEVDLKMFGVIPVTKVQVEVVDEMYVAALGTPFGMKLYTEGVLVIDLTDVDSADGNRNPAKEAGIKKGDYISHADGFEITCNEDLSEIVAMSGGKPISIEIIRNGKRLTKSVMPVLSSETETYRIGIWVKDSSAGIGTLTFYSPSNNVVCGLGHGICDDDTGSLLTVNSGEMTTAQIVSIQKGSDGSPGELKGTLLPNTLADIALNSNCGVYGTLTGKLSVSSLVEVALKQEVQNGEAQILCTVDGVEPKLYSCTIKKRTSNYYSKTQNLSVTVTDPELLQKTGGIVQGM